MKIESMVCRILAQLNIETGVPITDLDGIVVGLIIFNLFAALLPASGKLVLPEEELEARPKGSLQDPKISILQPKKFFGFSGFGFTKVRNLAQLLAMIQHIKPGNCHYLLL
jgi:photosystem II 22kDa protein